MNLSIEVVRNVLKFLERIPEAGAITSVLEAYEFAEAYQTFRQVLEFQTQALAAGEAARERASQQAQVQQSLPGIPFAGLPPGMRATFTPDPQTAPDPRDLPL